MFRLGTRPLRPRTSMPLVLMTSRISPCSAVTELGTSRMFSTRRSAVTVTTCSSPAGAADWACAPTWSEASAISAAEASAWCMKGLLRGVGRALIRAPLGWVGGQ